MNTALATRHNILKKDADGRWYSIPEAEVDAFIAASEAVENAEFMSSDWFEARNDLDNRYGTYRKDDL
jgi:hypothetical protein